MFWILNQFSMGLPCPPTFNPADHYIHKLSMIPKHESEYTERIEFICKKYEGSLYGNYELYLIRSLLPYSEKAAIVEVDNHILNGPSTSITSAKQLNPYHATKGQQFWALLGRSFQSMIKEPTITYIRLFQNIGLGLVVGVVYFDQKVDQVCEVLLS